MAKPSNVQQKKPEPGKSITKPQAGGAVAEQMPDFMKGKAGLGIEKVGQGDVEIPRIKLLQAVSPEVQEYGFKAGEFYHTIAEQSMGKEVEMVPVYIDIRFILWRPRHDGGGILARADDGVNWVPSRGEFTIRPSKDSRDTVKWTLAPTVNESGLAEWGSYDPRDPNSQPAATRMFSIVSMFPYFPELSPAVVTLQRSAVSVGRKFAAKLKLGNAPTFGRLFTMSSIKDTNSDNQDFWNYKFQGIGFVKDAAQFAAYEEMYHTFERMGVKIRDIEGLGEDDSPSRRNGGGNKDRDDV